MTSALSSYRRLNCFIASLFLIPSIFLVACQHNSQALVFERVISGDTFIASGKHIKIWGISAPKKNIPEGHEAATHLELLIRNKNIYCTLIKKDEYQREISQCKVDGQDIASDLVKNGFARDQKRHSMGFYDMEEEEAKDLQNGIWAGSNF